MICGDCVSFPVGCPKDQAFRCCATGVWITFGKITSKEICSKFLERSKDGENFRVDIESSKLVL